MATRLRAQNMAAEISTNCPAPDRVFAKSAEYPDPPDAAAQWLQSGAVQTLESAQSPLPSARAEIQESPAVASDPPKPHPLHNPTPAQSGSRRSGSPKHKTNSQNLSPGTAR